MKIIQVQTQAEAAGAQRVSDMIGEGLRARGHEVRTVFMYRKTDAYDDDANADFLLRQTPRGIVGQLRAAFGLFGYLRRERPDAVFSFQHYGNVFGTLGGRLAGARILVANQSGAPLTGGLRGVATWIDKAMGTLGLYQYSIVNSAWTEEQFASYPASYRARLLRIDHGVSAPEIAHDRAAARRALGLPPSVSLVISTGRLNVLKSHVTLVDAIRHLPAVHLAIAGAGPEREAILARAAELQLAQRVHLVGELAPARVFEFLAAGDVYAFSSRQETFGLAVVEAAITGVPVVASDLTVLREVLTTTNGEPAALFVPPGDATAFATAIRRALEDEGLALKLSTAGRELEKKYAPAQMCAQYEALLV